MMALETRHPTIAEGASGGSPSSGGGNSNQGSDCSSHQLTRMGQSRESNQAGREGRGLRMKVNLPIFKDEKTKDAVTYHSWRWDIAIFYSLGWDNQHLLLHFFWSLQGFSCQEFSGDVTLTDILQMLNKHYGIVMTFNALSVTNKKPVSFVTDLYIITFCLLRI